MSLFLLKVVPFLKLVLIMVSFIDFSFSSNVFLFFMSFISSATKFQSTGPLNLKLFLPISFFGLIIYSYLSPSLDNCSLSLFLFFVPYSLFLLLVLLNAQRLLFIGQAMMVLLANETCLAPLMPHFMGKFSLSISY